MGDTMERDLMGDMYKRAMGYYVTEVVEEYDGDGNMLKKKRVRKYLPPDGTALKEYLSLRSAEDDLSSLTEQQLKEMRDNYIKELKDSVDEKEKIELDASENKEEQK